MKYYNNKFTYCIIAFLLGTLQLYAYNLRQINKTDGLTNSAVLSLLQDNQGFLWFGTCDGINIYNGTEVSTWKYGKQNYSGYIIEDMLITQKGSVWIQTNYGLNHLDLLSQKVINYTEFQGSYLMTKNDLDDLFILSNDNYLYCYNQTTNSFYKLNIEGLNQENIINIYAYEQYLIIFTKTSISYYQLRKTPQNTYIVNLTHFIKNIKLLYGFGEQNQIYWLDEHYNLYGHNLDKPIKRIISNWEDIIKGKGEIADILRDGDSFFIGFKTDGVLKITLFTEGPNQVENLGISAGVFRLLKDRYQDIVWIATDGQGVFIYSDDKYTIQSITYQDLNINLGKPIRAIYLDKDQSLWLGTKGEGILKISNFIPENRSLTYSTQVLNNTNSGLKNNFVYTFGKSTHPLLWIGHDEGISYYSYISKKIISLPSPEKISYVHSIYEENDSTLWITTVGTGIIKATITGKNTPSISNIKRYIIDNGKFSSNYFFTLSVDSEKNIWFGNRGYGLFHIEDDSLISIPITNQKNYEATTNDIFSIIKDNEIFWIGSSYGLIKKQEQQSISFNKKSGFINSTIHTLLMDKNKHLWIATNEGLICFNTINNEFQLYNHLNGLNVLEFSDGASFSKNNTLYFGGINGFVIITENLLFQENNQFTPPLLLTNLNILGQDVLSSEYIKENKGEQHLYLNNNQNYFTIGFTTLDYINPNNYSYQYQLNDNNTWIQNGSSHTISFTQMQYGNYKLNIRYQNKSTGEISPNYTLFIHITPPWYLSTIAIWGYAIAFIACIYSLTSWTIIKQRRKQRLTIEKMERLHKEEVYEEKLRFFTNITHEFCTPLTLIYGPCERLLTYNKTDDFIRKYVSLIKINTERLNALIQEVIDFRRLETGNQPCNIKQLNISNLCEDIIQSFTDLAEQNNIIFQTSIQEDLVWNTDYNCITKILNNLISNAFKYTPENGIIKFSIGVTDNCHLCISVYNSGKGIKQENISQIFNRYKILENVEENAIKGLSARNGLGLAICHSMVDLLQGTISIKSEVNQYAEFIVSLPALESSSNDNIIINHKETNEAVTKILEKKEITEFIPIEQEKDNEINNTILIIDDNTEILALLQDAFINKYQVMTANNAHDAINNIIKEVPDIIITDIMMPGMNGIEFTKQIKQNKHTMSIPIIILSAKNSSEEKIEGLNAGADAYVGKPFDISYLNALIERLIDNKNKMRTYYNSSACAYDYTHGELTSHENKNFLRDVTEYIEKNISQEDLSIDTLANHLQISPRSLYRKFKELNVGSPKDYIKECRIELAAKLLRTTSLTVQEIIYKTGFINRSHFYKEFTKRFQMTPKDYRNEHKKKDSKLHS